MKVLVTGGAGFLGRGILRRAHNEGWDDEISILSRDEAKHVRVYSRWPGIRTIKADVSDDPDYLARLFTGFDVIIHAGSNKLVDVGEHSVFEVVKNNVIGSQNVAKAAIKANIKKVIGISTDKAVQPVNTYGASKMLMERMFQEADGLSDTEFVCARYGNVVGSTISIVLYFQQQLAELGYIKVTDPDMTRFYMGVDEAIEAIQYARFHAQRGSVVIPKMQAMSVGDVARLVLELEPGCNLDDERVHVIGHRPGEKLHESLLHAQESVRILPTRNDDSVDYFELRPSIEKPSRNEPFIITSNNPPKGWMSYERMKFLIEDAEDV